jgi:hypothetical protein
MMEPRSDGDFEDWASVAPTLAPILSYIGRYFLPWTAANAAALEAGATEFTVDLPGGPYRQPPQKYHARSLTALKSKYAAAASAPGLEALLADAGCLGFLQ